MPACDLPADPNLERLRNEAKLLLRLMRAADGNAEAHVREFHPRPPEAADFKLADAQLVVARHYGLPSWPKLVAHVEVVHRYGRSPHHEPPRDSVVDECLRLACLNYGSDDPARPEQARQLLGDHPELPTANIHAAAVVGDVDDARMLLAADQSLARQEGGPYRWEPLLYAAYSRLNSTAPGHSTLAVARLLLDAGADPNAGYLWEGLTPPFTALTGAFGRGEGGVNQPPHQYEKELARLLLEQGADPNDGQTLYNRHFNPDNSHLELLIEFGLGRGEGGPWHQRLADTYATPQQLVEEELRWSAADGQHDRVRLLIPIVDNIDGIGYDHPLAEGRTAHTLAVLNGYAAIAADLAAAGAAVESLTPVEQLRAAVMRGEKPDADLRALVAAYPRLLNQAATRGQVDAVRRLAGAGYDLNPTDDTPPIHDAAFHGHLDVVKTLIELGADPNLEDPDHHSTPLGWAEYNRQDEVVRYLRSLSA